jgi:UDP-N-acetyl-2-amino-2-deoxyglucuronate dehydrogenase
MFGGGKVRFSRVFKRDAFGTVVFDSAFMEWGLSIENGERMRSFEIKNGTETINLNLVDGFADLHTRSYQEIVAGRGFGLEAARPAIRLVEAIREGNG